MRVKTFFVFALLFSFFAAATVEADDVNAKDQVYALLMDPILQGVVGSDYGERFTGSVGKKNPYRDRPTQKVMVACIVWSQVTTTRAPFKYWNSAFNVRSILQARDEALSFCRSKGRTDCDCQVIDENDQNVLQIPVAYLSKFSTQASVASKTDVQPAAPSSSPSRASVGEVAPVLTAQSPEKQIPIALSWDGVGDLLPGHLTYTQGTTSSPFEISLPLLGERCTGHMTLSDASTGKRGRTGVWAIACPGQKGATGTFQISADGKDTCTGQDFQGRAVKCAFSDP